MKGVILQPTYLPWLGYFEMISHADIFIIYDHVQFVKKSWHHRNRIKGPNGEILLSIPTKKAPLNTSLCETLLTDDYQKVLINHWISISHSYKKSRFFHKYSSELEGLYSSKYRSLTDLTIKFIEYFCDQLSIETDIHLSSNFTLDSSIVNPNEKVINLCKKANLTALYDANGAQEILDVDYFKKNNIKLLFQNYSHPVYSQVFGNFIPNLSIIDLLLNEGPNSLKIIRKG
jgi:hypothetical protein